MRLLVLPAYAEIMILPRFIVTVLENDCDWWLSCALVLPKEGLADCAHLIRDEPKAWGQQSHRELKTRIVNHNQQLLLLD